jgi:gliding motility-associated-like protein
MTPVSKHMLRCALGCLIILAGLGPARAQLIVDGSYTPTELVQSLVGPGVTVSDVTLNCPMGAYGRFDASATVLPIDSGLLLTTGRIVDAIGPNDSGSEGTDNGAPGYPALSALIGGVPTNDRCVLEFDVEVLSDTLKFTYSFGSEEYLEFVGTSYNDVFAFWIIGPEYPTPTNIALIPGTALPVAINTVHSTSFSDLYINNGTGGTMPYAGDPSYIQYDGYTVPLEAKAVVTPCETYRLRLAIADGFDGVYDSGVFIKAGSLTSSGITLSSRSSAGFGFSNAIEGCVDGIISFIPSRIPDDTTVIRFGIGGTATNGVDYAAIADSVVLLPGMDTLDLYVVPFLDPLPEGSETVVIYLLDPCYGVPRDSVVLEIQDKIVLEADAVPDITVCPGDTVQLSAEGGIQYVWKAVGAWPGDTAQFTTITPLVSAWYGVSTEVGICTESDSVWVDVALPPNADAGGDIDLCIGSSRTLNGSGGLSYSWSPADGLDNPLLASPVTSTTTDIAYVLTVTDADGCRDTDTARVTVRPLPEALIDPSSLFICPADTARLLASGGLLYYWEPETGLDRPFAADPVLTATEDVLYTVTVEDIYGCQDQAEVEVRVDTYPVVEAGDQAIIDYGQSVELDGSATNSYIWSPAETLSDPLLLNPLASPILSTWYVLTATSEAGCITRDSVQIIVIEPPAVIIPTAFTPNGDGLHDVLRPVVVRDYVGTEVDFRIMNRWGETVFQSSDINTGWDGTFRGAFQEIGSYLYIFVGTDSRGDSFTLTGTLTLLR